MTDKQVEESAWSCMLIAVFVAVAITLAWCATEPKGEPIRLLPRHQVVDLIEDHGVRTKIVIQTDIIDEVIYDL